MVENLFDTNEKVLEYSATTLSSLVGSENDAEAIYRLGGVLALINLLSSPHPSVVSSAASAISNLAHSDICRRALVEGGALAKLLTMASHVRLFLLPALTNVARTICSVQRCHSTVYPLFR